MRWQANEIIKETEVDSLKTNAEISYESIVGVDPFAMRIDVLVEEATVVAGVTLKVQDFDGISWRNLKTVSVTTTAVPVSKTMTINKQIDTTADLLPMRERIRVVVDTGAGDSITISSIKHYRLEG